MRRLIIIAAALLPTLVLAAPAVAGKPVTYTVASADCYVVPNPDFREWGAGRTWHLRDADGFHGEMFLLVGEDWVPNGVREVINHLINFVPSPDGYTAQGEIRFRDTRFGDFDGTWMSNGTGVRSTLHGLDGAAYDLIKFSVVGQATGDEGLPTADVCGQDEWGADWYEIATWTVH